MSPITNDSKATLTSMRSQFLQRYTMNEFMKLKLLEQKFGKYIYLPFDVEPIRPKNPHAFAEWYLKNSVAVSKKKADVAGAPYSAKDNFLSINSVGQYDTIWETNPREDFAVLFPEIIEGMKQLPFKQQGEFSMWASKRVVSLHRDQGAWEDLPASFRIMLYDTNPNETLFLRERPPGIIKNDFAILPLRRSATNVFGWNNLRTAHGSTWNPLYFKILLIFTRADIDLDRYEDLLTRSVEKYGEIAHVSRCKLSDFVFK